MTYTSFAAKANEKMFFAAAIVLLTIVPFLLARIIFQFAQTHLPTWAQLVILILFFVVTFLWASLISGKRGERLFTQFYKQGIKWFFLFSLAMLVFALVPFAALHSILTDLGYTTLEPEVPKGEFWRVQDLYLWHFINSVPGLDIPETLLWQPPVNYKDRLSGVLLLAFKLAVIGPVIASFKFWRELNKNSNSESAWVEHAR
jgi:hypothetical protein